MRAAQLLSNIRAYIVFLQVQKVKRLTKKWSGKKLTNKDHATNIVPTNCV